MKKQTTNIRVDTAFSDDGNHRYYLRKIWDESKPVALIVSKSAGFDNGVTETTTQNILTNNLYSLGYGGFCLCNLFSEINGDGTDGDNTEIISGLIADKDLKEIIVCWGNLSASKESVQEQAAGVEDLIRKAKKKTVLAVSDGENINCHPLSPMVRKHFELVPYDLTLREIPTEGADVA